MKKRRAYRLLAAALAAVLLSGCAGKQESGKGDFKPVLDTRASVQLRVLGFFGNFEALDQVTNDFNRYYPNVTFSYGQIGGRDLEAYLDLNPGVDIMMVSAKFMNARNATLPARCRNLAEIDVSAIDEQMLKTYNIDGVQYECGRIKYEGLTRLRQPLRRIGNQPQLQPSPGHPSQLSGENCLAGKGIRLNISQGSSVQQPPDSQHSFTGME